MRADEQVVISKAELAELKKKAEQRGQLFDSEEMQAIREQYVELVEEERGRREELEFRMRMELARIRDIELGARRAAEDLRRFESSMLAILEEGDGPQVRSSAPAAVAPVAALPSQPAAPPPQATLKPVPPALPPPVVTPPPAVTPPPLPSAGAAPAPGSHADKFRQAMAHRKRYSA
jgi:hypothetical protein